MKASSLSCMTEKWSQKRRDTRAHGDEAGGMEAPLQPYHVFLFINCQQVGENQTLKDCDPDDASAVADARAFFTAQGYQVDEVTASHSEVRPANELLPALHGRILTVRLTNPQA